MNKVLAAGKLVLADLAKLEVPTYATAAAGVILPVLTAVGVTHLSVAEVSSDLVLFGLAAAAAEKLFSGQAAAHVAPAPVVAIAPPAPPAA
jgi:hypothetical protein